MAPRRRSPDTHVWVKPKLHTDKEYGPRLLHNGLSENPIRWRCLLRVLCPVRRPVTALDCVLLKERNLAVVALAPRHIPRPPPYPMLVNQPTSNLSSYILRRDPRPAQVRQTLEQSRLLQAFRLPHYLRQHDQRPSTVPNDLLQLCREIETFLCNVKETVCA